jgi:hypothetical protein
MSPIELIVLWAIFLCSWILFFDDNTTIFWPQKKVPIPGEILKTGESRTYTHEYQHADGSKVLADRGYYDFFTMQDVRQNKSI